MKNNSLFKNTIYKSLLNFCNIIVPLIIGPYITRLLDINLYGFYNKAFSVFQFFLAFGSFGIYNYGMREISKIRNDKKKVSQLFTNLLVISILTNLIVSIIYIIFSFSSSSGITTSIYLLFLIQFVGNSIYVEFVNEALENYQFITIKSVIVKLLYLFAILIFVIKPDDILVYTLIVSLTVFLNHLLSFIYAKRKIKLDFSTLKIKKYLKPLLIVFIITNVNLLYSQLDRVMLGKYVNEVSVTIYYIAHYLVSTLIALPYSIIFVSIPRLTYIIKNENKEIYEEKLSNSISSLLFVVIPMCLGMFVVSKEIILLYGGEKYMGAVIPLMLSSLMRIVVSFESILNNLVMYPNDMEKRILKVSFVCGILNLVLNYILIFFKVFSPTTAFITTFVAEFGVFIWHYIYAKNKMKIKINLFSKNNILYFVLSLLFIPISLLIRLLNLGFVITLGLIMLICAAFYVIVLYCTKDNNLFFILDKLKKVVRRKK